MRFTFLLIGLLTFTSLQAQERIKSNWIVGPTVAYQYQSKNFLKASIWGLTDLGFADYLKIDAGANFTWKNNKSYVIPELGVTYYLSAVGVWPYVKAEVTPYTISPKVGLGLFNLVEVAAGYGWALQNKGALGEIKGFNISVGLSLPLNYNL